MQPAISDFDTREVVLRTDFDLLDDQLYAWVSMRFMRGPRPPREGDVVYLMDGHGRGCVGTVEHVQGWYACVRPDFGTWVGGDAPDGGGDGGRDRSLLQ